MKYLRVLIALLSLAMFVACEPLEPEGSMEGSPPGTSPTARPTQSTASPSPSPRHKLALISSSCTLRSDIGFTECDGFVQNISAEPLDNVQVVILWYDETGTPITSDEALIDYRPILAGQQSPWSTIGDYNPAMTTFRVEFKEFWGGTISYRDDRP